MRSRTADFDMGVNWTFCARVALSKNRMMRKRAPRLRMVSLSYTTVATLSTLFDCCDRSRQLRLFIREFVIGAFNVSPWNFRIMGEKSQPILRNGLGIVALPVFQDFQRIQVISHGPGDIQMPSGGNQVRNVAGGLAGAANKNGPHVPCVAGPDFHRNSRRNFRIAINELHLA